MSGARIAVRYLQGLLLDLRLICSLLLLFELLDSRTELVNDLCLFIGSGWLPYLEVRTSTLVAARRLVVIVSDCFLAATVLFYILIALRLL